MQIQDVTGDILLYVIFIPLFPLLTYSVAVTHSLTAETKPGLIVLILYCLAAIGGISYSMTKALRLMKHRNRLYLGYECEVAVGQELTNRIKDGFNVYHDFPADGFNIDHVLVGEKGVFAIETKGRAKSRIAENKNWRLQLDGTKIIFPTWTETKPIKQAVEQAKYLSKWLNSATGSPCAVEPVLAIPGWYIERTAPSKLKAYNGKNSAFLAKGEVVLTPQQVQAISHQIEKQCRTVASRSYSSSLSEEKNRANHFPRTKTEKP